MYAFVSLALSKPWLDKIHVLFKFSLSVLFNYFALVDRVKAMFGLSIEMKDRNPKFMNFGFSLRM